MLKGDGGRGCMDKESIHTMGESLVFYKSFNTLLMGAKKI
jgi:hypothetical protein